MVTGRNGSGKSTLLRVLATAIRADRETASVPGHDLRNDRDLVRDDVALLGHRTHLDEPLTALESLAVAARFLGGSDRRRELLAQLDGVGLADRADDAVQTSPPACADSRLEAGMEIGVVLSLLLCTQGAIWAKPTWGVWWDWDPRLTTTAVMVFAFGGILALCAFVDDP